MNFIRFGLYAATVTVLVSGMAGGQTPNPNGDIVKMIQAGLPESTVVNKIREGAGHWDTSVDALIVLKQAGATDAELSALTSHSVDIVTASAQKHMEPIPIMGGYMVKDGGDISFVFTGTTPIQTRYHLILIDGKPSLRMYINAKVGDQTGVSEFLVEREKLTISRFGQVSPTGIVPEAGPVRSVSYDMPGLELKSAKRKIGGWVYVSYFVNRSQKVKDDGSCIFLKAEHPNDPSIVFLRALLANYDTTMATLIKAAGVTDASGQIALLSRFSNSSQQDTGIWLREANRDLVLYKEETERQDRASKAAQSQSGSGNGLLTLVNVMHGVANMAQAQSAANAAAANHDMAGQMQAAMNAGRAEAQTLNAISNPNAPTIQPLAAPDPNAIQNATNQQLANIQAKQAQVQAAQRSTATTQVARNTAAPVVVPSVAAKTASPSSAIAGSGTAAPPVCVDLGVNGNPNCMTQAQYQQMAQKNQQAAQMQVCPASGFVPGPGHYAACDAYLGDRVGCVPGQMVPVAVPAPPPAGCGPVNAGNGGGVSGGGAAIVVPGTGAVVGDRAGCQPVNFVVDVQSQWAKPHDPNREVIYFVTNQTIGPVTCTVAFHKNGDWTEYGTGTYKAGATHVGGEMAGSWTSGADSSAVKYACYQGDTPLDAKGNPCNANLKFTGPTPAGTDWR